MPFHPRHRSTIDFGHGESHSACPIQAMLRISKRRSKVCKMTFEYLFNLLMRHVRSHSTHKFHVRRCQSRFGQIPQPQPCIPGYTCIYPCIADPRPLLQFQLAFYRRKGEVSLLLSTLCNAKLMHRCRRLCKVPLTMKVISVDDLPNNGHLPTQQRVRCRSVFLAKEI